MLWLPGLNYDFLNISDFLFVDFRYRFLRNDQILCQKSSLQRVLESGLSYLVSYSQNNFTSTKEFVTSIKVDLEDLPFRYYCRENGLNNIFFKLRLPIVKRRRLHSDFFLFYLFIQS